MPEPSAELGRVTALLCVAPNPAWCPSGPVTGFETPQGQASGDGFAACAPYGLPTAEHVVPPELVVLRQGFEQSK